ALIPATTDAFSIVMVSDSPAAVGDVILAEDFSQFCWGADEISQSAGYWVTEDEPKWDTQVASSYSNHDAKSFAGTRGKYKGACWHAQKAANKVDGFRLSNWAQGEYARVYLGPGYVFLSTEDYCAHIITSELNSIPEGQTAKLKVTLHAAGAVEGGEAVVAVQHGISYNAITASTTTNKSKLDLTSNKATITYEGGLTTLSEFEVTLSGVEKGDRIAFGPTTYTAKSNSNMMILSDITVQIIELE
nr:hypothetical protein [Bacteroidales bacterium]